MVEFKRADPGQGDPDSPVLKMMLDQMEVGLRKFGIPQSTIDKARVECEARQDSEPFTALMKSHLQIRRRDQ